MHPDSVVDIKMIWDCISRDFNRQWLVADPRPNRMPGTAFNLDPLSAVLFGMLV